MPKKAGMEAWKKKRRIEYLEKREYRFYIFCEGEQTEPLYFTGFKKLIEENPIYREMVMIQIEACGAETMRVIGSAEEYVRKNHITKGQIWCVYDKDSFPAERFNGVAERAESLNRISEDLQYHVAWSNECIEYWFILYFDYYTSNNHRKYYIDYLSGKFKELGLGTYEKNRADTFNILRQYGDEKLAIRYAKRIIEENEDKAPSDIAPGTKVYELVEELRKYCEV